MLGSGVVADVVVGGGGDTVDKTVHGTFVDESRGCKLVENSAAAPWVEVMSVGVPGVLIMGGDEAIVVVASILA